MLNFYLEILLKKWPERYRVFVTRWRFWIWLAPIAGGYFAAGRWWDWYTAAQNWLLPALGLGLGIAAIHVFLRVVYEEVNEPLAELKALKEGLAAAESTKRLRTVKLIERLRLLESAGIKLRKEMMRTYMPDKHPSRHKAWQEDIVTVLQKDAPAYENEMLLAPDGRVQLPRGSNDRDFAVRDMDEWLTKLHAVIKAIDTSPST